MNLNPKSGIESPATAIARRPERKASVDRAIRHSGTVEVRRISHDDRRRMVAEAAYLLAERREFAPGGETDDWFRAEAEVDAQLASLGIEVRD
jgi:hypothetical protein